MIQVLRIASPHRILGFTKGVIYKAYIGDDGRYNVINDNGEVLSCPASHMQGNYFSVVNDRPKIGGI